VVAFVKLAGVEADGVEERDGVEAEERLGAMIGGLRMLQRGWEKSSRNSRRGENAIGIGGRGA
jgi:hypothetical protein